MPLPVWLCKRQTCVLGAAERLDLIRDEQIICSDHEKMFYPLLGPQVGPAGIQPFST